MQGAIPILFGVMCKYVFIFIKKKKYVKIPTM